jgi:hypothetical protein
MKISVEHFLLWHFSFAPGVISVRIYSFVSPHFGQRTFCVDFGPIFLISTNTSYRKSDNRKNKNVFYFVSCNNFDKLSISGLTFVLSSERINGLVSRVFTKAIINSICRFINCCSCDT